MIGNASLLVRQHDRIVQLHKIGRPCLAAQLDLHLVQLALEVEGHTVVLAHRLAGVRTDIEGLVQGDPEAHGAVDAAFGHLLAVYQDSVPVPPFPGPPPS